MYKFKDVNITTSQLYMILKQIDKSLKKIGIDKMFSYVEKYDYMWFGYFFKEKECLSEYDLMYEVSSSTANFLKKKTTVPMCRYKDEVCKDHYIVLIRYNQVYTFRLNYECISYLNLVDDYIDGMILCNNIRYRYRLTLFESENSQGKVNHNNEDYYKDIYQWYIIDNRAAEILENRTNEIILYDDELDIYVWGVTHFGTSWSGVPLYMLSNEYEYRNIVNFVKSIQQ